MAGFPLDRVVTGLKHAILVRMIIENLLEYTYARDNRPMQAQVKGETPMDVQTAHAT